MVIMKKGVVHILEAVLVSLTFVMVVPFLLYPTITNTEWDYSQKLLIGQDMFSTMDDIDDGKETVMQNIMNMNRTEFENYLSSNFFWLKRKKLRGKNKRGNKKRDKSRF